jgi:hypothetical protein
MAKEGLRLSALQQLVSSDKPWALCVGAGISRPIFPSWDELANVLASKSLNVEESKLPPLKDYFSSEVIIQASYEYLRCKNKDFDFPKYLSEELYAKLLSGLSRSDERLVKNCMGLGIPMASLDWTKFISIINDKGKPTALSLAELVVNAIQQKANLTGILTFNAEVLFPALINAMAYLKMNKCRKILDYITEPISSRYCNRIPYYFCHGLVPIPDTSNSMSKKLNAVDKLVFLENEYHQLANNSFSWQASTFFNVLSSNTVFFVGLSLRDQNIRRWLSWMHAARKESIKKYKSASESTAHYWIEKIPDDKKLKDFYEYSVAHLGIRIIWIDDWKDCNEVFYRAINALKKIENKADTKVPYSYIKKNKTATKFSYLGKRAFNNQKKHRNSVSHKLLR